MPYSSEKARRFISPPSSGQKRKLSKKPIKAGSELSSDWRLSLEGIFFSETSGLPPVSASLLLGFLFDFEDEGGMYFEKSSFTRNTRRCYPEGIVLPSRCREKLKSNN
jgi:hypothetical protein